jgi:hypothetical protein
MADAFHARATRSVRGRHEAKVRELAESLQANAGYLLADLDRGRVPQIRHVLHDALMIAERISALEAVREVTAIYESTED